MSDNAEIHTKVLGFIMAEWARKDNRQLVAVDLLYSPGNGYKDEEVRKWVRADEPELFAEFIHVEKLVGQIVEIAEGEVDAKPAGKHRFVVRCHQHMGARTIHSFALSPSYRGSDDLALTSGGGGGGGGSRDSQVLSSHASQLMRINAQMFEGTIRVLGQQNMSLHDQVTALTSEAAILRRELEEARSNKMDREFQIAMAAEKNARTNAGFQKLLQIGSVVAAKMGAGGEVAGSGSESPLAVLIAEFYQSFRPDQMSSLMQLFDMPQKIMFMEIVNLVRPPEPGNDGKAGPPPGPPPGGGSNKAPAL
ncbi:MAG TPA: hypothetical protein VK598_05870 [Nitrospiraceae bacterium]|nr:hypothetical protein [Nitrospiraceae bacterium]